MRRQAGSCRALHGAHPHKDSTSGQAPRTWVAPSASMKRQRWPRAISMPSRTAMPCGESSRKSEGQHQRVLCDEGVHGGTAARARVGARPNGSGGIGSRSSSISSATTGSCSCFYFIRAVPRMVASAAATARPPARLSLLAMQARRTLPRLCGMRSSRTASTPWRRTYSIATRAVASRLPSSTMMTSHVNAGPCLLRRRCR